MHRIPVHISEEPAKSLTLGQRSRHVCEQWRGSALDMYVSSGVAAL